MDIYLDHLQPGMEAVVTSLGCAKQLKQRLADFGLVSGTRVRCRYRSPDKSLSALELRGAVIAIRRADLHTIAGRLL